MDTSTSLLLCPGLNYKPLILFNTQIKLQAYQRFKTGHLVQAVRNMTDKKGTETEEKN